MGPASSTAVRPPMTLAFHLGPLSPARSWGRQNWTGPVRTVLFTGLYGSSSFPLAAVSPTESRLVRSDLACPPTCKPARAASDVLQSKSISELPPSQRHGPFCGVEVSNLRIKSHLPAAHAGLSAIGSGRWTDACASRSRSAPGFLQLCSCLWISRPCSTHSTHNAAFLTFT